MSNPARSIRDDDAILRNTSEETFEGEPLKRAPDEKEHTLTFVTAASIWVGKLS